MNRNATVALVVVIMVGVIVAIDIVFFRGRFWERLMANAGVVLLVGAFLLRFVHR